MMEVLIDQQAIKRHATDEPGRDYDLGHGLCSYEFFDQCPHRMACVRCDFYVPKESSQADLITSKANMIRMLQDIPLTDDERAAVEGDRNAIERLLERLATTPTPDRSTCTNCRNADRKLFLQFHIGSEHTASSTRSAGSLLGNGVGP